MAESPKKRKGSPKIKQKIFNSFKNNEVQTNFLSSKTKKNSEKKESFDIISKAKEVCDEFLKKIDQKHKHEEPQEAI